MPKLVVTEYVNRKPVHTMEFAASDFTGATVELMRHLYRTATSTYITSVILKWTGGPYAVGAEQPFDITEFGSKVGNWVVYQYRLEYPEMG